MIRLSLVALTLATFATDAAAGPFRRWVRPVAQQPVYSVPYRVYPANGYLPTPAPSLLAHGAAGQVSGQMEGDGLDELNLRRAKAGLRPLIRDEGLTIGARGAARFRAARGMFGHVTGGMGDFQFLPPGTVARATGCAAYHEALGYGWMSCGSEDTSFTYAGAWWVVGADGRRFMHTAYR